MPLAVVLPGQHLNAGLMHYVFKHCWLWHSVKLLICGKVCNIDATAKLSRAIHLAYYIEEALN